MNYLNKYTAQDSMSALISDNYKMLLVMSRFGIALGVGDKSIGEVCSENKVDTDTFLAIVNMLLDNTESFKVQQYQLSLPTLVSYLQNSHTYFLKYRLPSIREQLSHILATERHELSQVILHYFDEYAAEVNKHMNYEETRVFPYIQALLNKQKPAQYNIGIFSKQHSQIESRLTEFKNIIIKYYPTKSSNEMSSVLFDIFNCENDLMSHNDIENKILIPAIVVLENSSKNVI
ncbi:cation-binding protein [Bacteroidia bacterium]|nr:cation-binding protein [Bacteroidia bacterium]GHU93952.1 cation-binding protein [Bacteroidia bacterium]